MEALDQIMEALFTPYRRVPDEEDYRYMQTKGMITREPDRE